MMPVSRLNDLRRRGVEALEERLALPSRAERENVAAAPVARRETLKTARFYRAEQITQSARAYFDRVFLPLHCYDPIADGVVLPSVIFDGKRGEIAELLKQAKAAGAVYALVGNLGHLALAREADLIPLGDFRLNVCNRESVALWERMGMEETILSPELTLPQMRDVGGNSSAIVYGKIPLMLLEKCVSKELADCKTCQAGAVYMVDRKGIAFPVLQEWEHRSMICNSLPTAMSDKEELLLRAKLSNRHFLFTDEGAEQVDRVINAHRLGRPVGGTVRRM